MHSAPSVTYPVGRSSFAAAVLWVIWLLAAAVTALWWAQARTPGWRVAMAWLLLLATGLGAGAAWRRSAAGTLHWDGEGWSWPTAGGARAQALEVALDLQRWMLVRWNGGRGAHWLWLERSRCAERWDDLRRAVYSRARPEPLPRAQGRAAKP
jgi:toxin CptA